MDDKLKELLRDRFGLDEFRGTQREVAERLLAGGDAIVVWPTGSGKSLVYQLVALAQERPVLVLSPLIALMEDQVAALVRRGIAATLVNSTVERAERERRAADFARGRWRLLYVTPERFRDPAFVAAIEGTRVGLLAVDEAHCITTWGHDFRPEYGRVGAIRARLGDPPTVALTATATPAVIAEIRSKLRLEEAHLDHQGLARPNLFLAATVVEDEAQKWELVAQRLEQIAGAGIVYGALIRDLHRLEEFLAARRARSTEGAPAGGTGRLLVYHGDLSREERRAMHERFHAGSSARVLATRAFGMGIDRRDLRFILHHQVPGSLEELWQEIGRAGRDGKPSWCELLYCEQDLAIQMQFVKAANPDRRLFREVARRIQEWNGRGEPFDLEQLRRAVTGRAANDGRVETCLSWLAALGATDGEIERGTLRLARPLAPDEEPEELGAEKERRDLERLQRMVAWVRARECRRALLADHFGVARPAVPCGACDVCTDGDSWRARELATVEGEAQHGGAGAEAAAGPPADRAPMRGDFVRVDGRLLGRVVRVSGRGRDALVEVELAQTLEVRRFPARRHRIEVLQR
jgi:ATP-dependent DNA helicase RecQ